MYEIERDKFVRTFNKLDNNDLIIKAFEQFSPLFMTDSFVFIRNEEDVTIIRIDSLDGEAQLVNWYKLYHIGRCLNLKGFKNIFEFYRFIAEVVKELKGKVK